MKLAIIPARGGSKRIPGKNIRDFCGKPMIAWSIHAARESGCFDRIVVSTDSAEIADVARTEGADVPFMRPAEISDDYTGTLPVIAHAVDWHNQNGASVEYACCLYATAPFVRPQDLQQGLSELQEKAADYAFSVTSFAFPIQRAIRVTDKGRVDMFDPDMFNVRSQDLDEAYHDAGQFYWGQAKAWLRQTPFFGEGSVPVMLPRHRVQDIDTFEDWDHAEWMFKALQQSA